VEGTTDLLNSWIDTSLIHWARTCIIAWPGYRPKLLVRLVQSSPGQNEWWVGAKDEFASNIL